jgi:CO dehydrogenase/acetyl-CoA synthase beta subunit
MELLDKTIESLHAFVETLNGRRTFSAGSAGNWQAGGDRNIVLNDDMGLELGSPDCESVSSVIWTENPSLITNGSITLAGPDFPESMGKSLGFGKVVLVHVTGFTDENTYDHYRELELIRFGLDLRGFMIRAVSRYGKEWCRISTDALQQGFSSAILGKSLMDKFLEKPFVKGLEVVFITSSSEDVRRLRDITSPTARVISAMSKMAVEPDIDCGDCEYQDICNDAEELKRMRTRFREKTREAGHG